MNLKLTKVGHPKGKIHFTWLIPLFKLSDKDLISVMFAQIECSEMNHCKLDYLSNFDIQFLNQHSIQIN